MLNRSYAGMVSLLFVCTTSLWALHEPGANELKEQRARFEQWRKHPDRLARLREDFAVFQQLPEERRQRILQLDHDLHEENSASQARLLNVLERYTDWLEHLPEKERRLVQEAPTKTDRLARVKELREQEWMRWQPKALREQWAGLNGKLRDGFIKKLKRDEQQRRQEWAIAARFWRELEGRQVMPVRLADFDFRGDKETVGGIQTLVNEFLWPMLSDAEKDRLKKAEGHWPTYPQTLVEIADRHPLALPGPEGPRLFTQLPSGLQTRFRKQPKDIPKILRAAEGKWPEFGVAVTELAHKQKFHLPNELWPYSYQCLLTPMKEFVDKELTPVLSNDEKPRLLHAEEKWPKYPETIQELARAHHLQPPWQTALPGPRERWENYRLLKLADAEGYPDVPRQHLREFAVYELSTQERATLRLNPDDPESWQRLRAAYFQRRQGELKELRRLDQAKGNKTAPALIQELSTFQETPGKRTD